MLAGQLPFVCIGDAPRKLVVFPGLADAARDVRDRPTALAEEYKLLADEFTVYVIGRRRGLSPGYTTRKMAADYARAIEEEIGPANVLGISLGGYIAQFFAADYPQHVQRMVIACAAYRFGESGREIPRRWLALARAHCWTRFYMDILKVTFEEYHDRFRQFLGPLLHSMRADPGDFLATLEASLAHDGSEALSLIKAPTLVISGTLDRLFPESLVRETARRIPHASLQLIENYGHSVYQLRNAAFSKAVRNFLVGQKAD